jgi:hypothetical protein
MILQAMLSLPPEYKRDLRLEIDIIESQWPELLRFPFNAPLGIRGFLFTLEHAIRRRWARWVSGRHGLR